MKQLTAKTVEEVLVWIETTCHHKAYDSGRHLVLEDHFDRLRVPLAIWRRCAALIKPGDHFDRRMYRITASGRQYLRRRGISIREEKARAA